VPGVGADLHPAAVLQVVGAGDQHAVGGVDYESAQRGRLLPLPLPGEAPVGARERGEDFDHVLQVGLDGVSV
jgi:hypothetical protein